VTLVINVADARNQTPQSLNNLKELVQLHQDCGSCGLEILAFPSDQFRSFKGTGSSNASALKAKVDSGFHLMDNVCVNGAEEHPVFAFMKHGGPEIRGDFQTAFLIKCRGDHCKIRRYDDKPPRALRARIEELFPNSGEEDQEDATVQALVF
jgi:glutathione peroxidase-family protein